MRLTKTGIVLTVLVIILLYVGVRWVAGYHGLIFNSIHDLYSAFMLGSTINKVGIIVTTLVVSFVSLGLGAMIAWGPDLDVPSMDTLTLFDVVRFILSIPFLVVGIFSLIILVAIISLNDGCKNLKELKVFRND